MIELPRPRKYDRQDKGTDATLARPVDPTPEQIADACERIRATWSALEFCKRATAEELRPPARVEVQVVAADEVGWE